MTLERRWRRKENFASYFSYFIKQFPNNKGNSENFGGPEAISITKGQPTLLATTKIFFAIKAKEMFKVIKILQSRQFQFLAALLAYQ